MELLVRVTFDVRHSSIVVGHHESLWPNAQECIYHWKPNTQTQIIDAIVKKGIRR